MKFLILGSNGMAGHIISIYLKEQGYDVTGFARTKSDYITTIVGDAKDLQKLSTVITDNKYDFVVNCIGILNQFAEKNHGDAVFLNSYLPHFLADITADMNTQIIHISTDCVFSGKSGSYTEHSFRDGETFYDRTKALGELVDTKNITLRNSIVGPDINKEGIGLLNWFMKQDNEINGFTKAMWTGQTTLQLAKTIEAISQNKVTGLYNMVPDKNICKFELLKLFNRYFKNDKLTIRPVEGIVADKTLIRTNFQFDYSIPDYETMICELSNWMNEHKYLYKHYNLE